MLGGGGFENQKYPVVSLDTQHDNDIINAFNLNYKNYDPFNHEKRLSDPLPTATTDGNTLPELDYQCNAIVLEHLDILSKQDILLGIITKNCTEHSDEKEIFYFHGDHLGSASWITETNGKPIQYIHYAPYGEFIDNQRTIDYDERYKFTGKERDSESGYDYFGARYYASPFSFWLSVDPLADKYPAISPYAYCTWNPMKNKDPNGKWVESLWDVANVAMGAVSFNSNVQKGNIGGAIVDGVGILIDVSAAALPLVPAGAGSAIKAYRAADNSGDVGKVANKIRQAVMRGIQSEKRVLKDMGLTKNTSKIASKTNSGKPINVIPDAIQDGVMYEVKDTKAVYNTSQIQGEYRAAKNAGYDFKIVTGEKTHVSSNIPSDVEIIRRSDLGPQ